MESESAPDPVFPPLSASPNNSATHAPDPSFMKTKKTGNGDFFDVSEVPGKRPEGVTKLGGGVERFLGFLREQVKIE